MLRAVHVSVSQSHYSILSLSAAAPARLRPAAAVLLAAKCPDSLELDWTNDSPVCAVTGPADQSEAAFSVSGLRQPRLCLC